MTAKTALDIIKRAHQDAGKLALGGTCSADQNADGIDRLNDIINLWATQGIKLWLMSDLSLGALVVGQAAYTMGPGGSVNMTKPLSVIQGYWQAPSSQGSVRQPLELLSKEEYTRLSQTNVNGAVSAFYPDKGLTFLTVNLWNPPDSPAALGTVHVITRVSATNVVLTSDTVGFPQEWIMALRWALADELSGGMSVELQNRIAQRAGAYRDALEGFDVEDAMTYFSPDPEMMMGGSFS